MNGGKLTAAQRKRLHEAFGKVHYAKLLGMMLQNVEIETATVAFNVTNELKQNNAVIHGGAIASLIDTAAALAIMSTLSKNETTTTVDLTISYLRPLLKGTAVATARVIKSGRRLAVASAEVTDDAGKIVATALTTYIKNQQ
jgi:uncharacterized protein (TIGR00369 family)